MQVIEAGVPAMGRSEQAVLRRIAESATGSEVVAWCRALSSDISAAVESGVTAVHLTVPVSDLQLTHKLGRDREWARRRILDCVAEATDRGLRVSAGFEDASRADDGFVIDLAGELFTRGVIRVRWADTVGILDPFTGQERLSRLVEAVPGAWEIHAHDDFGLATANTLAAVRAGFTWVSTTVCGLGERAGNAAMEEVAMALTHLYGFDTGLETKGFRDLACLVSRASRRPLPVGKAVIGGSVFTHESGIHADGVIKSPSTYEPFDPTEVGGRRRLVIGKHSGRASLRHALALYGISTSTDDLQPLLDLVRARAAELKRSLRPGELLALFDSTSVSTSSLEGTAT